MKRPRDANVPVYRAAAPALSADNSVIIDRAKIKTNVLIGESAFVYDPLRQSSPVVDEEQIVQLRELPCYSGCQCWSQAVASARVHVKHNADRVKEISSESMRTGIW